jgi:hypothetical protein
VRKREDETEEIARVATLRKINEGRLKSGKVKIRVAEGGRQTRGNEELAKSMKVGKNARRSKTVT